MHTNDGSDLGLEPGPSVILCGRLMVAAVCLQVVENFSPGTAPVAFCLGICAALELSNSSKVNLKGLFLSETCAVIASAGMAWTEPAGSTWLMSQATMHKLDDSIEAWYLDSAIKLSDFPN